MIESMERRSTAALRLRLAMGEFVAMWGDVETYIVDHLNEMADAAKRREEEIQVNLACNTPGTSTRNKEKEFHISEVWFLISCLADTLQNSPDAPKLLQRDLFHAVGMIPKLRQQPFHPTAGILWQAKANNFQRDIRDSYMGLQDWGDGVPNCKREESVLPPRNYFTMMERAFELHAMES